MNKKQSFFRIVLFFIFSTNFILLGENAKVYSQEENDIVLKEIPGNVRESLVVHKQTFIDFLFLVVRSKISPNNALEFLRSAKSRELLGFDFQSIDPTTLERIIGLIVKFQKDSESGEVPEFPGFPVPCGTGPITIPIRFHVEDKDFGGFSAGTDEEANRLAKDWANRGKNKRNGKKKLRELKEKFCNIFDCLLEEGNCKEICIMSDFKVFAWGRYIRRLGYTELKKHAIYEAVVTFECASQSEHFR